MTDAALALYLRLQTCANRPDAIKAAMRAVNDGLPSAVALHALAEWDRTQTVQTVRSGS